MKRSAVAFLCGVAALCALAASLQLTSMRDEVQTFDEDVHLAAGYSYWKTGDFRLNREHPPLGKLLCAAPLLLLHPDWHPSDAEWKAGAQMEIAPAFLYRNRVPAERILFAARTATVAVTLLLILAVAVWARSQFGAVPALFAAALVALDPNILAHGRYVTNDALAALVFLVAVAAWVRYLRRRTALDLLWAGLALGLALTAKFSMVGLLPVFAAIYAFRAWQEDGRVRGLSVDRFCGSMLAVCGVGALVVIALYGHWPWSFGPLEKAIPEELTGLRSVAALLHLPAHPFLVGLSEVAWHNQSGHTSYLLGDVSRYGWWYYFPVVFLVKTPTAPLLLTLFALVVAVRRLRGLRRAPLATVSVIIAVLVYAGIAMAAGINLGLRHLLPVFPLLYILVTALVWKMRRAAGAVLLCAVLVQAAECARIHPYYLAFFNTLSGGPARGPHYLVDSNIDWGQDLYRLKRYLDAHGETRPCLAYFGRAPVERYFREPAFLPRTRDAAARKQVNCLGAISVTLLQDDYMDPGDYAWLRGMRPMARVGYSIYVYDLRRRSLQPEQVGASPGGQQP